MSWKEPDRLAEMFWMFFVRSKLVRFLHNNWNNQRELLFLVNSMAIPVVEFSIEGYKIRKIFG